MRRGVPLEVEYLVSLWPVKWRDFEGKRGYLILVFFSLHFKDWCNQTNKTSVLANDSLTLVTMFSCSTHLFLFSFHFSFYNIFLCICSLRFSLLHLYFISFFLFLSHLSIAPSLHLHPPAGRLLIVNKWALHFSLSIWQQPSFTQCSHMPHWYLRDPLRLQHLLLIYMCTHTFTHAHTQKFRNGSKLKE